MRVCNTQYTFLDTLTFQVVKCCLYVQGVDLANERLIYHCKGLNASLAPPLPPANAIATAAAAAQMQHAGPMAQAELAKLARANISLAAPGEGAMGGHHHYRHHHRHLLQSDQEWLSPWHVSTPHSITQCWLLQKKSWMYE